MRELLQPQVPRLEDAKTPRATGLDNRKPTALGTLSREEETAHAQSKEI